VKLQIADFETEKGIRKNYGDTVNVTNEIYQINFQIEELHKAQISAYTKFSPIEDITLKVRNTLRIFLDSKDAARRGRSSAGGSEKQNRDWAKREVKKLKAELQKIKRM